MDKKFLGIIVVMLIVFLLIVIGFQYLPWGNEDVLVENYGDNYTKTILDKEKVTEIYISVAESDYANILQNPTKEEYIIADVIINDKEVNNVGFRIKGNSSLSSVASSDSERYSFKLDFDQYIDGQNLEGLTKLNLNNSFSDPSYMREYLSYSLLSQMGVPTPAYSYANIYINGQLHGLYLAVEGIEEPFLERYYGKNSGNLYKPEGEGSDLVYTDDNIKSYAGISLVTDGKNGWDKSLLAMIEALNEGKDLEEHLNIDEILRYFAVNTVLVNMDSYQGNLKHNYYLYEENGIFSILPWDYNMSFGGFGGGGSSSQGITTLYIDQPVSGTTLEQRPLIGKLLEVEEYKDLYHHYVEEFINGPFSIENMNNEIERIASLIRTHVANDPTKFYTLEQFEQALTDGISNQDEFLTDKSIGFAEPNQENKQLTNKQNDLIDNPDDSNAILPQQPQRDNINNKSRGGMIGMGGNIGLAKFVRERIENVSKQLNGELPSVGDSTEMTGGNVGRQKSNGMPQMPQGEFEKRTNNMERPVRGGASPEFNKQMDRMDSQNMLLGFHLQELILIGGSILLLVIVLLVIFRKKTKYSI